MEAGSSSTPLEGDDKCDLLALKNPTTALEKHPKGWSQKRVEEFGERIDR